MKLTLTKIATILNTDRRGALHVRRGNFSIHVFTGSTWKGPRKITTLRVWPYHPQQNKATLPEVLAVARPLAVAAGFPVIAEAGKTMFRVLPDGRLEREPGSGCKGPRKPLP